MKHFTKEHIANNFHIVESVYGEGLAHNKKVMKERLNCVHLIGEMTYKDLGQYYACAYWDYDEYVDNEDGYVLFGYTKHGKLKKLIDANENIYASLDDIIYYSKLGRDMLRYEDFGEYYYKVDKNIFSFSKDNRLYEGEDYYIDPDIADYCYEAIKSLKKEGISLNDAADIVFQQNDGRVA